MLSFYMLAGHQPSDFSTGIAAPNHQQLNRRILHFLPARHPAPTRLGRCHL